MGFRECVVCPCCGVTRLNSLGEAVVGWRNVCVFYGLEVYTLFGSKDFN